jgi:hypothetical protein
MEYEGKGWMGDGSAAENWTAVKKAYPSDHLSEGVLGNWKGDLNTSEGAFRINLHIWQNTSGKLTGAVDSPDQDVTGISIRSMALNGSAFHFEVAGIEGSFDGTLDKNESSIEGTWTQHDASSRLQLRRVRE